jgi:hypothetical protein
MDSNPGFDDGASEPLDIEWRAASVDTALFGLVDRLQRERRAMASHDRPRFGIVDHQPGPGSSRFA